MKIIVLNLCICWFAIGQTKTIAQITISRSGFSYSAGTTIINQTPLTLSAPLQLGENSQWEFPAVGGFANSFELTYQENEDLKAQYPNSLVRYAFEFLNPTRGYNIYEVYQMTDNGVFEIGAVVPEQHYGIGDLSGNVNDSLTFASSVVINNSKRTVLRFPLNFGGAFSSTYNRRVDGQITVTNFGLNKALVSELKTVEQRDSIVGWGKVRIPTGEGKLSAWLDVLLDKRISVNIDSIYLNNSPAPAPFMTAFGLVQGERTTRSRYILWRPDFIPVASIDFTDTTFTELTQSALSLDGSIPPEGANGVENSSETSSFATPNPASSEVTLHFTSRSALSKLSIVSSLGEIVSEFTVFASSDEDVAVPFNTSLLASGVYQFLVRSFSGSTTSHGRFVVAQ